MATEKLTLPVSLGDSALRDLSELAKYSDRIIEINKCALAAGPAASPSAAGKLIAAKTSIPESSVARIVNALSNLRYVQEHLEISAKEVFEHITSAIEYHAPEQWKAEFKDSWDKQKEPIVQMLEKLDPDHPLSISRKAEQLTYTQPNLLLESRIITDIRPIFNDAGNAILESIVTHSLVVKYSDGESTKKIHLSMDAEDIATMKRLCERAEKKAITMKKSLKELPWPTTVAGEKKDA